MIKFYRNLMPVAIIVSAIIVAGALIYALPKLQGDKGQGGKASLSAEAAVKKAVDYINAALLPPEQPASLVSIYNESDISGLYKFRVKVADREGDSYVTKDGNLLFPEPFVIEENTGNGKDTDNSNNNATTEVPKTDKPDVKLFVMSYCPYGLQAEKAILPSYDLFKDKVAIGIYFVDYTMHGKPEVEENLRQYCIQKEQPAKFVQYLSCFANGKSGEYQKCLDSTGIDQAKLSSCITATDRQFNITQDFEQAGSGSPKFSIYTDLNDKYGVQGSPTLIINDTVVNDAERSPEGFKKAICQAFKNPPEECSKTLSTEAASAGFGSASGSSGSGGACQ